MIARRIVGIVAALFIAASLLVGGVSPTHATAPADTWATPATDSTSKAKKCNPKPTPKTSKKVIKKNNKELTAAKKAALKKLRGFDVIESRWVSLDGVHYDKLYVGKKFQLGEGEDLVLVRAVAVPTKWGNDCRHDIQIRFARLDLPTETFTASRQSGTYTKDFWYEEGETGGVTAVHVLPGADAKSKKVKMGNS